MFQMLDGPVKRRARSMLCMSGQLQTMQGGMGSSDAIFQREFLHFHLPNAVI